eukprot:TRINITY_DN51731_c0_g1_i1.p1 TRINITY_DN51731_c0_g1~~TRINITY_DN51731_c0_g1_i1.p1  ORF type:complete len:224 (+),score=40.45 TRINITY_DN51731_c0_g1_i1:44-715(+)
MCSVFCCRWSPCCHSSKARDAKSAPGSDVDSESESDLQSEIEEEIREHAYEWDSLYFPPDFFCKKGGSSDSGSEEEDDEEPAPLEPILGSWKCIDTWGMDEFLKATGVSYVERKLAAGAKWPRWEFQEVQGGGLLFINHTNNVLGDLREEISFKKDYISIDGRKNELKCSATWTKESSGSYLRTSRTGSIGTWKEERCVVGDKLKFTLTHSSGVSWGRSFIRD